MKKYHKKFPNEMNLFLINSIYTLTLLMFLEIFFFLLDGINTFEVITLKERLSQIIWCFFFLFAFSTIKNSRSVFGKYFWKTNYIYSLFIYFIYNYSSFIIFSIVYIFIIMDKINLFHLHFKFSYIDSYTKIITYL